MPKNSESNKPKRTMNPYMLFCKENHTRVKKSHPHSTPSQIVKELARQWRNLEDRSHYIQLAKKDKLRYRAEKEKTVGMQCNSYILFCKAHLPGIRLAYPKLSTIDHIKQIAAAWNSLEDKSYYQDMARRNRKQVKPVKKNRKRSNCKKPSPERVKPQNITSPCHTEATEAKTSRKETRTEVLQPRILNNFGENDFTAFSHGLELNIDHSLFDVPFSTNDYGFSFSQVKHLF